MNERSEPLARVRQAFDGFCSLLDQSLGYAIFFVDLKGLVVSWNDGAERLKGYRAEEIIGRHVSCFYPPEASAAGEPEAVLRSALEQGTVEKEGWRVRKDGSRFWANIVVTAVRDAEGSVCGFAKVTHDATARMQIEVALRASREGYREILKHLPAGVVVHAADTSIRFANERACALLGLTPSQMAGKTAIDPAWRFVREDGTPMPLAEYPVQRVLATRSGLSGLVTGIDRAATGDRVWVLANAFPELEGDELRQIVVTFTDITERKRAEVELRQREARLIESERQRQGSEAALRDSENRYRNLFEAGSDAYFLIDNQTGRLLEANDAATSLYGYSRKEFLELTNTALSAEPEQTSAATRQPKVSPGLRVMIPARLHRKKDGTVFPVDITARFFEFESRAVHVASIRDITERRRAEELLRLSEEKFATAFRHSLDAITITEPNSGLIVEANEGFERVYGYTRAEVVGRTTKELGLWYDLADRERLLAAMRAEGQVRDFSAQGRTKSGMLFDAELTSVVINLNGVRHLLSMVRDVTGRIRIEAERRSMEASLAQADRLSSMGMLAAGVAHEINNPLSYVLFNLESLAEDIPRLARELACARKALETRFGVAVSETLGQSHTAFDVGTWTEIAESCRDAVDGGRRIRDIVRGLGTFSRVERDQIVPVDLRVPIESALSIASNEVKYRARLVTEIAATAPVLGSEGRLSQVFLNLVINAAQSIGEGDVERNTIRVRTWQDGSTVLAEVEDTGAGIRPEDIGRIFEPFVTTKDVGMGSGLGLSIVRNIVAGYRGTIDVVSEVGHGSRFLIRFPAAETHPVQEEPKLPSAPLPPRVSGRVLVVDDEAGVRGALKRILASHEVLEVDSGERACELLALDSAFDVILSDMMMPNMSGMELHRWLIAHCPVLAQRLVFVTGGAFTPQAKEYLEQVDCPRLEKPFDVARVRKLVSEFVEESQDED